MIGAHQILFIAALSAPCAAVACGPAPEPVVQLAEISPKTERLVMPAGDVNLSRVLTGEWAITLVGETTLPEEQRVILKIEGGQSTISAGCNTISATLVIGAHDAAFLNPVITKIACSEDQAELETQLMDIVAKVNKVQLSGAENLLFVDDANGLLLAARRLAQ